MLKLVRKAVMTFAGLCLATACSGVAATVVAAEGDSAAIVLTNLSQFGSYVNARAVTVQRVRVEGIVTWRSTTDDAFVLQDDTGAALFQSQLPGDLPGLRQTIRLDGRVAMGNGQALLRQWLQLDHDGLHAMSERSARQSFRAGFHPFQLDYFQAGREQGLEVFWQGTGFSRQRIPAQALVYDDGTNQIPGVRVDYHEGGWAQLPDFGRLTPSRQVIATNLEIIEPNAGTNFGLRFTGRLRFPTDGEYRFFLASDDGSRLSFLERPWQWLPLADRSMPLPQSIVPGQPLTETQNHRWSEVQGEASFVGSWSEKCVFNLVSDVSRMRIEVASGGGELAGLLPQAQLRIRGVCVGSRKPSGPLLATELLVPSANDVEITSLPEVTWRRTPSHTISAATDSADGATIFRLSGVALAVEAGRSVTLGDETNRVTLLTGQADSKWTGLPLEALVSQSGSPSRRVLEAKAVRVRQQAPGGRPPLISVEAIRTMPLEELRTYQRARVRGVVISEWSSYSITVHDGDYGISCWFDSPMILPRMGDFVEVDGHLREGAFGPNIAVVSVRNLGRAPLPVPLTPTWEQLINGSLDHQWVEVEGVVQNVRGRTLALGVVGGRLEAELLHGEAAELLRFQDAIVRMRGTVLPIYNAQRQVEGVKLRLGSPADIQVVMLPVADPFTLPEKTIEGLSRFDPRGANPFYRVRMRGQVIYSDDVEGHLVADGHGLRFQLKSPTPLKPGDWVDLVGYPSLGGAVPQLGEAVARVSHRSELPLPAAATAEEFFTGTHESKRVVLEAVLLSMAQGQREKTLELQYDGRFLTARVRGSKQVPLDVPVGSRLRLTGTSAGSGLRRGLEGRDSFELLINRVSDVVVLARPPWWTVGRVLILVGILTVVLAASLTWIYLLHQKVEQRTAALDREMRQRKEAELQRAAEQERSRIARDLHDDLGASLTEISLLAEMGQSQAAPQSTKERFDEIADKSRALVNSMDVIVWAADPDDDDLESFADYVTSFARMFLESSGIACRFKVPIEFPQTRITGGVRHDLVLAIKEALNNIVRHARASEVDFGLQHDRGRLTVSICDNGCGFEAATVLRGNGLTNLEQRLTRMGGACDIESAHGGGTKVRLTLDLGLAL